MKKEKSKLKKINFRNFKTGSVLFMTVLTIFRILMIIFWLIAPIILALTIAYDNGIDHLVNYIGSQIYPNDLTWATNLIIKILAPLIWFLTVFIMLFATVKPFFNKKLWNERAYMAFNFIFWPTLFIIVIYTIWLTMPFFYSGRETSQTDPNQDPIHHAWKALQENYSPFSGWMIALQVVYLIMIIFGIFSIFEAYMVKNMKLDYDDFLVREFNKTSLVSQVIEGKIEFGEFDPDQVNKELKRIRRETIQEEKRLKIEAFEKSEEERLRKKKEKKELKHAKRKKKN
ncbi:hypothetical protein [Spiroplasma diminutum]|uniref:Transmembrane protein n=1 Tax=Spiroplasma diminutum CUAS-1 TaxID=1276221 RepID=S5MIW3_9MOLU|nr:hypothetical protein [Spiroplasma diminutum]AGR41875.1 hypothetical protein SDIMI_v3c01710 [Spiroplasma diminutum CUAS-1]